MKSVSLNFRRENLKTRHAQLIQSFSMSEAGLLGPSPKNRTTSSTDVLRKIENLLVPGFEHREMI